VRPRSIATLPLGSSPLSGSVPLRLWPVKGSKDHPVVTAAKADMLRLEQAERDRLLYVALTRPRDRLYIAGFTTVGADKPLPPESWYAKVERALAPLLATDQDREGRPIRVLEVPQTAPPGASRRPPATVDGTAALPEWAIRPAADETAPTIPLVPSQLAPLDTDAAGDALEAPPRPRDDAPALPPGPAVDNRRFLRGTLTHALLEHLPALPTEHWVEAARAFVAARGAVLDARRQASIVAETLAILRDPTFAPLFGPESQAEVPIVAVLERPQGSGPALRLTGVIDRLAVTAQGVLILDYKTNRPPPTERADVPLAYRLQLAAYRLAVQRLYPGQPVTAAILWTDGARLMEIPAADLDAAEPQLWR
jgi:ATP-dependent helicase/nuclease subunit A